MDTRVFYMYMKYEKLYQKLKSKGSEDDDEENERLEAERRQEELKELAAKIESGEVQL
jgi:hypothetical protein